MRIVHGIFAVLMILFVAVQYNDPDGPAWMAIYGVPAAFALLAAVSPAVLQGAIVRSLLVVATLAALGGVAFYWPTEPDFWREQVWWQSETAREGMGVMIAAAVLLVVLATSTLGGRRAA